MDLAPLQFDKKRFHGISSRIPSLQTISSPASEGLRTTPIDEIRASMVRSGGTDPQHTSAFMAGVASFATWGLVPIYWKLLSRVPALEILAHRFVWTIVFLGLLLSWQERWREVIGSLRGRLSAWQTASILIALVAVSILAFGYGHFPWIALGLCTSFGLYGLLRKQSGTAAIPGLFLETLFLLPLALIYLVLLAKRGALTFGPSHPSLSVILTTTGIVTAVPLLWFGYAARHLRLVTIGFLQYLSPSISFILGLFVYHETFTRQHFITFLLIWIALVLVSAEAVLRWRATKRMAAESPVESPLIEPGI